MKSLEKHIENSLINYQNELKKQSQNELSFWTVDDEGKEIYNMQQKLPIYSNDINTWLFSYETRKTYITNERVLTVFKGEYQAELIEQSQQNMFEEVLKSIRGEQIEWDTKSVLVFLESLNNKDNQHRLVEFKNDLKSVSDKISYDCTIQLSYLYPLIKLIDELGDKHICISQDNSNLKIESKSVIAYIRKVTS